MESLCAANTTFAVDLLRMLCEKKSGQNVFFSPFSISSALSMVLLGSKGSTEAQISKVGQNKLGALHWMGAYGEESVTWTCARL
uniref:Serpin domain-containing protein n=1 Tax=Cyanistes caeruleus TaxID=156563 RepID=A0A8C0U8A0_CYACU